MQNPLEECDITDEDATLFIFSEDGTIEQRVGTFEWCDWEILFPDHFFTMEEKK